MIGLEININGQNSLVAASDDFIYVCLMYGYSSGDRITVKGSDVLHNLIWFEGKPEVGDKVLIKVVETDKVSPVLTMRNIDKDRLKRWYEQLKSELQEKGLI